MAINADKPHLWKADIAASVDLFNTWFIKFAPKAYRDTRLETTKHVEEALRLTNDLRTIDPSLLKAQPGVLPTLRMSTCPPIARDRLVGLAGVSKNLVYVMEEGKLPPRATGAALDSALASIAGTIGKLLDHDIFPWLQKGTQPTEHERFRASTIVADRLCGAVADPIVRNAQERRQLDFLGDYLRNKGYTQKAPAPGTSITDMEPATFSFRYNLRVGDASHGVNIPIDCVVQPRGASKGRMPVLIEAKSAGDFTNVNKRRKEEATKMRQLLATYGKKTPFILFLCGYFDSGYLGYEAAEGIDWVWEHRIEDLDKLGI